MFTYYVATKEDCMGCEFTKELKNLEDAKAYYETRSPYIIYASLVKVTLDFDENGEKVTRSELLEKWKKERA